MAKHFYFDFQYLVPSLQQDLQTLEIEGAIYSYLFDDQTQGLDKGVDLVVLSRIVGHQNVTTTSKYDLRGQSVFRDAIQYLEIPVDILSNFSAKQCFPKRKIPLPGMSDFR